MYNYDIFEFLGNLGVALLIITYYLHTTHKIRSQGLYYILNIAAASLLLINLCVHVNMSGIIIETFWIGISILGMYKHYKTTSPHVHK